MEAQSPFTKYILNKDIYTLRHITKFLTQKDLRSLRAVNKQLEETLQFNTSFTFKALVPAFTQEDPIPVPFIPRGIWRPKGLGSEFRQHYVCGGILLQLLKTKNTAEEKYKYARFIIRTMAATEKVIREKEQQVNSDEPPTFDTATVIKETIKTIEELVLEIWQRKLYTTAAETKEMWTTIWGRLKLVTSHIAHENYLFLDTWGEYHRLWRAIRRGHDPRYYEFQAQDSRAMKQIEAELTPYCQIILKTTMSEIKCELNKPN